MTRALIRVVTVLAISFATVTVLHAGKTPSPPFRQCSASGYNCNILIVLEQSGATTYTLMYTDPNQGYYPLDHVVGGSLIGFQNNTDATVYSLSLKALATDSSTTAWVCTPRTPVAFSANTTIVNIPYTVNTQGFPYFYYNVCVAGQCPRYPPPDGGLVLANSCDVIFARGVPKGGTAYFDTDNLCSNFVYFSASASVVVPEVRFQDSLVAGETANATLNVYGPSPLPPVTLTLGPTTGTGSAVFATNSTTMTINQPQPSQTIAIKGATPSSTTANVRLSAVVNSVQRVTNFTVIDLNITGKDTVWWFNGATPSGYDTQVILTSSPGTNIKWNIVAGYDKVSLTSNGNQATVSSTGSHFSGTPGDISITATIGGVTSNPFVMTARTPWKLVPQPSPVTQCFTVPKTTYITYLKYDLHDNLDTVMSTDASWNEVLGTPTSENESNWGTFGGPSPSAAETNPLEDMVGSPDPEINPTLKPLPTCGQAAGTTRYMSVPQTIRVGSDTNGSGVKVQEDTLGYYIDHGQHDDVKVPSQPPR